MLRIEINILISVVTFYCSVLYMKAKMLKILDDSLSIWYAIMRNYAVQLSFKATFERIWNAWDMSKLQQDFNWLPHPFSSDVRYVWNACEIRLDTFECYLEAELYHNSEVVWLLWYKQTLLKYTYCISWLHKKTEHSVIVHWRQWVYISCNWPQNKQGKLHL